MAGETPKKIGRPRKYNNAQDLQDAIDDYFENGVKLREVLVGRKGEQEIAQIPVPTITGLVLHVGYESRQSFYDLEKDERFSYTVKRARTFIEKEYEEQLAINGGSGPIFALKNFGWVDKTENEVTGKDGAALFSEIVIKHVKADA
jgi:DNA-packaging protein gp3